MKDVLREMDRGLDREWLKKHTLELYRIERKQTFPAYQKAAGYVYDLLEKEGFDAELIDFPADGRTVYQDKITPIGWDVGKMRLTVLTPVPGLSDPVIADYEKEPLMAVKHSVSTPPDGLVAKVVTEAQMKAGEDVRNAFVLLNPVTRPRLDNMRMLLDLGAVGWISDFMEDMGDAMDRVAWVNAACEYNAWHVQADDRDFISYQITPRDGMFLRQAAEKGQVLVRAESDGRRYETVLPAVTAALPGECEKEVWMIGHLYEPLVDDNSNGVVGSIAILRILRDLAAQGKLRLKYSVRVIFASEMYGFAAMAERLGGNLSGKVIGATNLDGILGMPGKDGKYHVVQDPACEHLGNGKPDGFAGNLLMRAVGEAYSSSYDLISVLPGGQTTGDDCFLADSTVGVPVNWFLHRGTFHHNSIQQESFFDPEALAQHLMMCGAWVRAMAAPEKEMVERLLPRAVETSQEAIDEAALSGTRPGEDLSEKIRAVYEQEWNRIGGLRELADSPAIAEAQAKLICPAADAISPDGGKEAGNAAARGNADSRPLPESGDPQRWYHYSGNFIFGRAQRGFPHDLAKLPLKERKELPGSILYVPLGEMLSRMDGKKTFREILRETEWNRNMILDEKTVRDYLQACLFLAEHGYLTLEEKNALTAGDLAEALRRLGVREGDTLLVHSAMSRLGHLTGGAQALISALREAVGETGTFLAPAFARPYVLFEGAVNRNYTYRPYDRRPGGELRDVSITTGILPRMMLREPGSYRSGHISHEWAAIGGRAEEMVSGHGFLDPPAGETSPLKKALDADGSVIFLGCHLGANTFLHYLEDHTDAPFLQPAVMRYIESDGTWKTGFISRHLPGHRDFYDAAKGSRFYDEAVRRGLRIDEVPFGMTTLRRIRLKDLYEIGMEMFREDPAATLCDDPDCPYCAPYRKKYRPCWE